MFSQISKVCLFLFLSSASAWAQTQPKPQPPKTLLEAIAVSIKYNQRTVSTNEFLDSVRLAIKAVKASQRPSGFISCGSQFSWNQSSLNSADSISSRNQSQSCGISASYNLFDGGALKSRIQAAIAAEEALIAQFNTSDSRIDNTKGGLADSTKSSYLSLVQMRERILFFEKLLRSAATFKKISQDNTLIQYINNLEVGLVELNNAYKSFSRNFAFFVKNDEEISL